MLLDVYGTVVRMHCVMHHQVGGVTTHRLAVCGLVNGKELDMEDYGTGSVLRSSFQILGSTLAGRPLGRKDPLVLARGKLFGAKEIAGGEVAAQSVFLTNDYVGRRLVGKEICDMLDLPVEVGYRLPKELPLPLALQEKLKRMAPPKMLMELGLRARGMMDKDQVGDGNDMGRSYRDRVITSAPMNCEEESEDGHKVIHQQGNNKSVDNSGATEDGVE